MVASVAPHLLAPRIATGLGAEKTAILAQGCVSVAFVGLALAPSALFVAVAFVLRQAAASVAAPLYASVLHTRVDPEDSDAAAGYRMIAQSIVWAAGNFIAGPLIGSIGFAALLSCAAAAHLVAALVERFAFARAS